jgi:hypothetical protein
MNFLLMLQAYGTQPSPGSSVSQFDFDGNGFIDVYDLLVMLNSQPEINESTSPWKQ